MAGKGKSGKSVDAEAVDKKIKESFQALGEDWTLTIKVSIKDVPVGGQGPRPKKDELMLALLATLTALLAGKSPRPKKPDALFKAKTARGQGKKTKGARIGGPGRKPGGP